MNRSFRRCISSLLCTAMLCGLIPGTGAAAEEIIPEEEILSAELSETPAETAAETSPAAQKMHLWTEYNPLYKDILPQSENNENNNVCYAEVLYTAESGSINTEDYHTDDETAAEELRSEFIDRTAEIHIKYRMSVSATEDDILTAARSLWNTALQHTGAPKEGDSLKWQYGRYEYGYRGVHDSDYAYLELIYLPSYYTTAAQEAELDTAVDELLEELNLEDAYDYEIIKSVYDWICANVRYDYDNLEDNTYTLKHTAYAALIDKTAVCQGYALLMYRLMLEEGIDCRLIPGDGGGPHAWNIVELNDVYYNVDATWDAESEPENYSYFLLNTESFVNHTRYNNASYGYYDTEEFHAAYPMAEENYITHDPDDIHAEGILDEENGITWNVTYDGTLTISGEGAMPDFTQTTEDGHLTISTEFLPWDQLRGDIVKIVVEPGITSIGDGAFFGCTAAVSAEIADTVKTIGMWAFASCSALEEIMFPAKVTSLGSSAFSDCTALEEIVFCGNAPVFENNVFGNVTAMVYYPTGYSTWTNAVMQNYGGEIAWTELDFFEISDAEDLYTFAELVNSGHIYLDAELLNDITVNEDVLDEDGNLIADPENLRVWTPIGDFSSQKEYSATFDGGGHTISGLYINEPDAMDIGLFGYTYGTACLIKNIIVEDSYFYAGSCVGGIVGACVSGTIQNCINRSTVGGTEHIGGIAGMLSAPYSSARAYISTCENTGNINGRYTVGGIVGGAYIATLTNCRNAGQITGRSTVGGIAGVLMNSVSIYNSLSISDGYLGGDLTSSSFSNCYYIADSDSDNLTGTTAVTPEQCRSGEIAFLLGSEWGQTIGKEDFPVLGGAKVYKASEDSPCTGYTNNADGIKEHEYNADGICIWCGAPEFTVGKYDINGDGTVSIEDALFLLRHTILAARYPLASGFSADFDGDGFVTAKDAVSLMKSIGDITAP